jgi:DNA-binding IclR family transcriptional regulator
MIQVVNRAFDILEIVAKDKNKVYSLTEIADGLGLNHGTCANIIKTMVQRNYLEQIGHKKGYKLGFMSYQIGGNHSYEQELLKAATKEMESLTLKMNETCLLAILKKNIRVILHQVHGNHDLMVKSSLEKAAFNSASGRLLVAMLDDNERENFVEKYGLPSTDLWKEASTHRGFETEVEKIRDRGYATQITKSHIVGFAVPIQKNERTVASLSMYLPESRFNSKLEKEIVVNLNKAAAAIGKKLGTKKEAVLV